MCWRSAAFLPGTGSCPDFEVNFKEEPCLKSGVSKPLRIDIYLQQQKRPEARAAALEAVQETLS